MNFFEICEQDIGIEFLRREARLMTILLQTESDLLAHWPNLKARAIRHCCEMGILDYHEVVEGLYEALFSARTVNEGL